MKRFVPIALVLTLAGCGGQPLGLFERRLDVPPAAPAPAPQPASAEVPESTSPLDQPPSETTVGSASPFSGGLTNPDEDGGPAAAATPTDGRLGNTVAALGDPGESGFWLRTPLVSAPRQGRVVYLASGRSVQVELRPLTGPAGGRQPDLGRCDAAS